MSSRDAEVLIGADEVLQRLINDCNTYNRTRFTLVADPNTYLALGAQVEILLKGQGWHVKRIILENYPLRADENALFNVLDQSAGTPTTYLAVGSGTIHDITRFISHRTQNPFISLPTAASGDSFASENCSLIINGYKSSHRAQRPIGIYAYLPTLCAAPISLTTAGFGEMLGKFTTLVDWKLGYMLWNEPYSEHAAQETWLALQNCIGQIESIARYEAKGIRYLTEALIEAGFGMQRAGNPHPAGGSEHQIAYFWEINRLRNHRPPLLHGERVGIASCLSAGYYATLRRISADEAKKTLHKMPLSLFVPQAETIEAVFGPLAKQVKDDQEGFLEMDEPAYKQLKRLVLDHWTQIQSIAATVPGPRQMSAWLQQVGAPAEAAEAEIEAEEVSQALQYAYLLRGRFTILTLAHLFGMA
jgi:glycerol-1-phosphate dehydrogenase [NAD(P)+]